jgi:sarcosine oxidase subunit gamma
MMKEAAADIAPLCSQHFNTPTLQHSNTPTLQRSNMNTRRSPVHEELEALDVVWQDVNDMPAASRISSAEDEASALDHAALCDLSFFRQLGLNGSGVGAWLSGQGITVSDTMYGITKVEGGGMVAKIGTDEVIIESGATTSAIDALEQALADSAPANVYPLYRQEASFAITGPRTADVLAQTCSVLVRDLPADALVYTRVAGVSAAVLQQTMNGQNCVRLIFDISFGVYLWHQLSQIISEYGGGPIGYGRLL